MAVKTREKLIEVARQLFARNGVENTTMNDIAEASDKGRRTVYTYFKSKLDIFNAVIERESEQSVINLREIIALNIPASVKLEKFLRLKFKSIQEDIVRQDSLSSYFSIDLKKFNKIRRLTFIKETEILRSIIEEGISLKEFSIEQSKKIPALISAIFQSVDSSIYKDTLIDDIDNIAFEDNIIEFIVEGIKEK